MNRETERRTQRLRRMQVSGVMLVTLLLCLWGCGGTPSLEQQIQESVEDVDRLLASLEEPEKVAILAYARTHDLVPTEEEVDAHLQSLIETHESSENYEELEAAYEAAGTTFTEYVTALRPVYAYLLAEGKVYQDFCEDYVYGQSGQDDMLSGGELEAAWEEFVADLVAKRAAG